MGFRASGVGLIGFRVQELETSSQLTSKFPIAAPNPSSGLWDPSRPWFPGCFGLRGLGALGLGALGALGLGFRGFGFRV